MRAVVEDNRDSCLSQPLTEYVESLDMGTMGHKSSTEHPETQSHIQICCIVLFSYSFMTENLIAILRVDNKGEYSFICTL